MVIRAILDTSIIIDLLRNYPPAVLWLNNNQLRDLGITHIVWMETIQGAQNKVERDRAGRLLRQFRLEHSTTDDNN